MSALKDMLDQAAVIKLTGIPRSTLYHLMDNDKFPRPKKIGTRIARWSKKEILNYFELKGFSIEQEEQQ